VTRGEGWLTCGAPEEAVPDSPSCSLPRSVVLEGDERINSRAAAGLLHTEEAVSDLSSCSSPGSDVLEGDEQMDLRC
jgi:hypothetical protein